LSWLKKILSLRFQRNQSIETRGERNLPSIICASILTAFAVISLIYVAWVPQNLADYVDSRGGMDVLSEKSMTWSATQFAAKECLDANVCQKQLSNQELPNVGYKKIRELKNTSGERASLLMRIDINNEILKSYDEFEKFLVVLPRLRFEKLAVFHQGKLLNQFHNGELVTLVFQREDLKNSRKSFDLVLTIKSNLRYSLKGANNHQVALVSSFGELHDFKKFMLDLSSGGSGQLGMLAKVVLALFCLLLFLIVDSSPESLGLALFMGFEAVAMGIGKGWFPMSWLGLGYDQTLVHFSYQMGDILKLYFLLQIARVGPTSIKPWLFWGILISIPYGYLRYWGAVNNVPNLWLMSRTRDTITAGGGALACFYTLWKIRSIKLPWRKGALTVAAFAGSFEVLNTYIAHSAGIGAIPIVKTVYTVLQANIGYLFALSTFLNISTLENRVKMLTIEQKKTDELKRQLELARAVQNSFLELPNLPKNMTIDLHYKAADYVSGDTYFVHWDNRTHALTFLLNDVTGHGVQAALKAFATTVIARTIWPEETHEDARRHKDRRAEDSRLIKFDQQIDRLLCGNDDVPDFNATLGVEFLVRDSILRVYRVNYVFPILVESDDNGDYKARYLNVPNRKVMDFKLKPDSIVLLVSDGIIETTKEQTHFLRNINKQLIGNKNPDPLSLKQNSLEWFYSQEKRKHDDETIILFKWHKEAIKTDAEDTKLIA